MVTMTLQNNSGQWGKTLSQRHIVFIDDEILSEVGVAVKRRNRFWESDMMKKHCGM